MDAKVVYVETMGCQMNKLDSELVIGDLTRRGYRLTEEIDQAGVIIFNTCSVRQHAEDKVISKISQLRKRHKSQPELVLAIIGCMAQRMGQDLQKNHPHVAIVCGPSQIHQLGELIEHAQQHHQPLVALNDDAAAAGLEDLDTAHPITDSQRPFMAFVRIMRGCNNFCSYCVVPHVRGREYSRPLAHIVAEARQLVQTGVKEINLLGQAVNFYHYTEGDRTYRLADVLEAIHDLDDLERIRFVTNYPRDFDDRLLKTMADLPKVCEYLHICAQSGSDRILKAMNRHYTAGEYLALIERARSFMPDLTVAGDFIVGFCGETEEDFAATQDLMRKMHYKNCYIFKYSPRPGTYAAQHLPDDVPEDVKQRRNQDLLELQNQISWQDNQRLIGQQVEIMVEGPSKNPHLDKAQDAPCLPQLIGRTRGDQIVVFNGPETLIGQLVHLRIQRASALTLFGQIP